MGIYVEFIILYIVIFFSGSAGSFLFSAREAAGFSTASELVKIFLLYTFTRSNLVSSFKSKARQTVGRYAMQKRPAFAHHHAAKPFNNRFRRSVCVVIYRRRFRSGIILLPINKSGMGCSLFFLRSRRLS